jgi:eukaryotic-like serine/threonine-protein kinase
MSAAGEERQADPFVGRIVDGRFEVEVFLGSGAVGSVYRARDRQTARQVALKIWTVSVLDDQTRGRFQREAMALTTLRHPNIVDVVGYGVLDDLPYVAMEYLQGETLEHALGSRQPLETQLALEVATQVLSALAYAHGLGVVHRDLKPDNVLLARGAPDPLTGAPAPIIVKLLDYGLAKFLSPEADPVKGALTMLGMIMGTPLYMAPEQAAGRVIDERVDVYAAGCLLFEMLSGQPPYLGESNSEILRAHMVAPVPRLGALRPDVFVSPALEALIHCALAKRPEQRYSDAGKMLEALNSLPKPPIRRQSELPLPPLSAANVDGVPARSFGLPSERLQLMAALATGLVTALALAYALLH